MVTYGPNLTRYLVFVNKFYWNMDLPIQFSTILGSLMLHWPSWAGKAETLEYLLPFREVNVCRTLP